MNNENLKKLSEALYNKGFAFSDKLKDIINIAYDIDDLRFDLQGVQGNLNNVLNNMDGFVSRQKNQPSEIGMSEENKRAYNSNTRTIEQLVLLTPYSYWLEENLLNKCSELESFTQDAKTKGLSDFEIAMGLKQIKNNIDFSCNPNYVLEKIGMSGKYVFNTTLQNLWSNTSKLADTYLNGYLLKLTPEEQKEVSLNFHSGSENPTILPDELYRPIMDSQVALWETEKGIREHSSETKDGPDIDKLINTIINDFDKLNDILNKSFNGGQVEFDADELNRQLKVLENNFGLLYNTDRQFITNNENSSLNVFMEKMNKRLSESTQKSISAIRDFIPESFERNIINANNLIETAEIGDSEKSALIKAIVKDSVIYMNNLKGAQKPGMSEELGKLLKKAEELSRDDKTEETIEEKEENVNGNTTIEDVIEDTIDNVIHNTEISNETKEEITEEVVEQVNAGSIDGINLAEVTTENVKSIAEDVVNHKVEMATPHNIANTSVINEGVIDNSVNNASIGVENINIQEEVVEQQIDSNMMSESSVQATNSVENSVKHPLERYKSLIEKYDVQFVKDDRFPDGHFVVTERATGKVPEYIPTEQRPQLTKDLAFAKSWISSCASGLSTSGQINEFGYDERVWEYAFNDGAMDTFTSIVDLLKNNTNPNLNTDMIINMVSNGSTYKYSRDIVESLLRERDNPYILNNIHERLLAEAGFGHDISQVLDSGGMDMNN